MEMDGKHMHGGDHEDAHAMKHDWDALTDLSASSGEGGGMSVDEDTAARMLDEYVNKALELGLSMSHVCNSDIREGEEVIRLSDGSYVKPDDLRRDFPDEAAFYRLAIAMNECLHDADIAAHWNDTAWLHVHAMEAMERRASEDPDDITIGFSLTIMPSPEQWSEDTGKPVWEYPARFDGESDHDFNERRARVLREMGFITASKPRL